ncbi:unnamed protein product [Choristocarpus tenellus]
MVDRIFREQIKEIERAEDIMTAPVQTCSPNNTINEVGSIMDNYGIRGMPVVNSEEHVIGMITVKKVDKVRKQGRGVEMVKAYMAVQFDVADARDPLHEVEELIVKNDLGQLPVMSKGELVGLITREDMLRQHNYYGSLIYHNKAYSTPVDSPARRMLVALRKKLKKYDVE